jgi:hypothetical protein
MDDLRPISTTPRRSHPRTGTKIAVALGVLLVVAIGVGAFLSFGGRGSTPNNSAGTGTVPTAVAAPLPLNGSTGDDDPYTIDRAVESSPLLQHTVAKPIDAQLWAQQKPQLRIDATGIYAVDNYPVFDGTQPADFDPAAVAGNDARLVVFNASAANRRAQLERVSGLIAKLVGDPAGYRAYLDGNFGNQASKLDFDARTITTISAASLADGVYVGGININSDPELLLPGTKLNIDVYYAVAGTLDLGGRKGLPFELSFSVVSDENNTVREVRDVVFEIAGAAVPVGS